MADFGTGLSGALGGAGTGFTIGGPIGAGVGGLVGLLSGLFGGNKKQSTWMSTLTPQQQQAYGQMLSFLMKNYQQQPAGNNMANMGAYTLMNRFYPGQMQMPTQQQQGPAVPPATGQPMGMNPMMGMMNHMAMPNRPMA